MKFHSSRRTLAGWLFAVASSLLVAACGGGGAATSTGASQGGIPLIGPDQATFYAGVPSTITITGGRRPYALSSSEPSLLPVPPLLDAGSFQVIPANPGVVDANLPPGSLPLRTVIITARDSNGLTTTATIKVGLNFLTGYGATFSSNCPSANAGAAPSACAGGETLVTLRAVTNGNLFGDKPFRFEVIKGPYQFVDPVTGQQVNSVVVTTDHSGVAIALLRVASGVPTQLAIIRITDVATGVYVDEVFAISQTGPSSTLVVIPPQATITGNLTTQCGTGSMDFQVFDGVAPYTAVSSDPHITVTPTTSNSNPARFTATANDPNWCVNPDTITITDATGARGTFLLTTAPGSTAPTPPTPFSVSPTTITLSCGTSGSVSVIGGSGSYFTNSTHPRVTAVVSGNTVTITRLAADPAGSSFPLTGSIAVSDGTSIAAVTLTVPAFCP